MPAEGAARPDLTMAAGLAVRALANIEQRYPWQPAHLQIAPGDHAEPHELHPPYCGSYDWHSCVHMHWLLARVRRAQPRIPQAAGIVRAFDAHLTAANVAAEAAYFARPGTQSFERTYGWAWLLALADELAAGDAACDRWARALAPLTGVIEQRYLDYLPRARYPIRHGVHANSAFGLAFALDHARAAGHHALAELALAKALEWFGADRDLPVAFEPSGADFLSPALMEAELMRRVLPRRAFAAWLTAALPVLDQGQPFEPVEVSDRGDPQIVHLDGLNLSRGWCLQGIAGALPEGDARAVRLRAGAERHLRSGLVGLASDDYAGAHWLASFALLALTAG
jgi:hypothetical protein